MSRRLATAVRLAVLALAAAGLSQAAQAQSAGSPWMVRARIVNIDPANQSDAIPSLGVPAVDLAVMRDRLRPGWFLAFIEHPESFSPGTRMTRFWMPGLPIFPAILGGDPVRQREAVWNYLSMGTSMTPPAGLRMSDSDWELTPVLEPMLFATFMRGVSPRTLCVGYTDLVHVAYDAEHARLATRPDAPLGRRGLRVRLFPWAPALARPRGAQRRRAPGDDLARPPRVG